MIKEKPEIARVKFRATNQWIAGTHNRATVKDFYGALKEDSSREPMIFIIDEPPVLCGMNLGANPVEYLLVALSGCLTTSLIAHAAALIFESDGRKRKGMGLAETLSGADRRSGISSARTGGTRGSGWG